MSEIDGMTCPACGKGTLSCYLRYSRPRVLDGVTGSYRCSNCPETFAYAPFSKDHPESPDELETVTVETDVETL